MAILYYILIARNFGLFIDEGHLRRYSELSGDSFYDIILGLLDSLF